MLQSNKGGLESSGSMLLEVYRDRTDYLGREAQDGHLNFHTALNWALSGENNILVTL